MKIALRREAASGATASQIFFCNVIKTRLVSQFCHGGIVIDGVLYHTTANKGTHKVEAGDWNPDKWFIVEIGGDDEKAKLIFEKLRLPPKSKFKSVIWKLLNGYDWFSLLAFVGPFVRVGWLNYCFETCWAMYKAETPTFKVTPELLLSEALHEARVKSLNL